jgi:multicomponent Na+:H+ antiporter subunit F
MSGWMLAVLALMPAFAIATIAAFRGGTGARFVATQLVASITIPILVLMTFAFDQSALIDLALTVALLSLPATLLLATFLERWL